MAMSQGTLKWGTLARMPDQDVYDYFRYKRGQTHRHALNSTRKVRSMFTDGGERRPKEVFVPWDFFVPAHEVQVEGFAPKEWQPFQVPVAVAPPVEEPQNQEPETPEEQDAEVPKAPKNDNAASALAAMIAPAMADMVSAEIEKAVARLHENMAPVRQLVVVKAAVETTLGDMFHTAAPKIIQLINQGCNIMLVGPAGCGKTMLADTVARSLKRELTIVSCSAGMSEAQLLGRLLPLGAAGAFTYVESPFMRAYANGGVILLDEMDAADANLLLPTLGVLALIRSTSAAVHWTSRHSTGFTAWQ